MNPSTHVFEPEEVMAYLDGELDSQRAAALASHLDHCPDCRALANQFRRLSELLLEFQLESPSANFNVEAIREQSSRHSKEPVLSADVPYRPTRWYRFFTGARSPVLAVGCTLLVIASLTFGVIHLSRQAANKGIASTRLISPGANNALMLRDESSGITSTESAVRGSPVPGPITDGESRVAVDGNGLFHGLGDHAEDAINVDGQPESGPMVARTATLAVVVKDFTSVESSVKNITARYHGYIGELSSSSPQNSARTLTATLHIPSAQLEAALTDLKQLGRVEQESQSGEEVTKEYTDLDARLKNSRVTEERLQDVLRKSTGKVADILKVEQEIARVRGEIEQMDSEKRALRTRIDYAGVQLSLAEDFKASIQVAPPSTATRLHNALVDGYRSLIETVIGFFVWLLASGPTLLIWIAILFFPVRWIWRRWLRAKWARLRSAPAA